MEIIEKSNLYFNIIKIRKVNKTVAGGRKLRFSVLVAVGDKNGSGSIATGKSSEIIKAIQKAKEKAIRNVQHILNINNSGSIYHNVEGKFCASKVEFFSSKEKTGLIVSNIIKLFIEVLGIRNLRGKCRGSKNAYNVIYATFNCLLSIRTPQELAVLRGKKSLQYWGIYIKNIKNNNIKNNIINKDNNSIENV